MKKLIALILVLATLALPTGCAKEKDPEVEASEIAASSVLAEEHDYLDDTVRMYCDLPEEWEIASAEERAEMMGLAQDILSEADLDKAMTDALETTGTASPFYAKKDDGLVSLNITVQNATVLQNLLSVDALLDATISQLDAAFGSMGFNDLVLEKGTTTFLGREENCVFLSGTMNQIGFYETIVVLKQDNYFYSVVSAAYGENETVENLSYFRAY